MASLIVTHGSDIIQRLQLTKDRYLVGRSSEVDIILDNPLISRTHAAIFRYQGMWMVEDLSKKNGVFVNGSQVPKLAIHNGDIIEVGKFLIKFCQSRDDCEREKALAEKQPGAAFKSSFDDMHKEARGIPDKLLTRKRATQVNAASETMAVPPEQMKAIRSQMEKRRQPHFIALTELNAKTFPLQTAITFLGKDEDCQIQLNGVLTIAGRHASVEQQDGQFAITHLAGLSKMLVNGVRVTHAVLSDGDEIEIGSNKLKFMAGLNARSQKK